MEEFTEFREFAIVEIIFNATFPTSHPPSLPLFLSLFSCPLIFSPVFHPEFRNPLGPIVSMEDPFGAIVSRSRAFIEILARGNFQKRLPPPTHPPPPSSPLWPHHDLYWPLLPLLIPLSLPFHAPLPSGPSGPSGPSVPSVTPRCSACSVLHWFISLICIWAPLPAIITELLFINQLINSICAIGLIWSRLLVWIWASLLINNVNGYCSVFAYCFDYSLNIAVLFNRLDWFRGFLEKLLQIQWKLTQRWSRPINEYVTA